MLDRESTFADETIVKLLKNDFIPVAIDQWYTRREQDTVGDFWRKIAGQGPRNDFSRTTQGLYIADASGKLLGFNNNRGPSHIRAMLQSTVESYQHPIDAQPIKVESLDTRFHPEIPEHGAVIRVNARVESGYAPTDDRWLKIFQSAVSRDNLWVTRDEIESMRKGQVPDELAMRIARFHLIDNTRGEPGAWPMASIESCRLKIEGGQISGKAVIRDDEGKRGYEPELRGKIEFDSTGQLTSFQMVARGDYWGAGQYTLEPPPGKFPLTVAFVLADGKDIADEIPPQGSRGWLDGYLHPNR